MAPKIRSGTLIDIRYNQLDKAIENAEKNLASRMGGPLSNGYYEW
jgi:hypothetical protein